MNWKRTLLMVVIASMLSSTASIIYLNVYKESMIIDYSNVIRPSDIISACTIGCILMAISYKYALHWKGPKTTGWLNIAFSVFSFATIAGVMGYNLPLETESPELFPGLIIPMHFFPVLSILTIQPFYLPKTYENNR